MKTAIIGIGSELRGDDGIGPLVIEKLAKKRIPGHFKLLSGISPGPGLVNLLTEFEEALIIDAADIKQKPGTVRIIEACDINNSPFQDTSSTHGIGLRESIAMFSSLGVSCHIRIAAVQFFDISYRNGLSARLEEELPSIIWTIMTVMGLEHTS